MSSTDQTAISKEWVYLATACVIHYELNTGMDIRYLKGEYVGNSHNANKILASVSPYISVEDCEHIKQIIIQGCPSRLDFEEDYENKHEVLRRGNQHTFLEHPDDKSNEQRREKSPRPTIRILGSLFFTLLPCDPARHLREVQKI